MSSPTYIARETARRLRGSSIRIGEEVRRLRLDAGVSLRELGSATSLDPSHLARIEKGRVQPSIRALTLISVALGADLSLRFYAGSGPRIRDRFQAPMIEALIAELDPRWTARLEVPIPRPARGIVDLVLADRTAPVTVIGEAQSEFRGIEQQLRWLAEKANTFAGPVSKLLIVRSTEATREVARRYAATLSVAYPARSPDAVAALTGDHPWPGDAIVWMRLQGGTAELLRHPPRGVPVGR
jgi:transcriptional regulator with XRE-family HTH domain